MKQIKFCVLLSVSVLMLGCSFSGGYYAPVAVIGESQKLNSNNYVVRSGDTLYSIAWMYGYDYRDLAHWNGLRPPYKLYKDQTLSLTSQSRSYATRQSRSFIKIPNVTARQKNQHRPPRSESKKIAKSQSVVKKVLKKGRWYKPAQGEMYKASTSRFYQRKGIEIKGQYGSPIHSAASGKVVYSGTGVRGYGNLIIIEHTPSLLSAYAFNKDSLVKVGQYVKANQVIAHMGYGPKHEPLLYFEVRLNGSPVDPRTYIR